MSTDFHIVVDITAGINVFNNTTPGNGFYLIPVQAPPTLQLKPDYSHTLTITLKGVGNSALQNAIDPKKLPQRGPDREMTLFNKNNKLNYDVKTLAPPPQ
jgi:hypothetical protein